MGGPWENKGIFFFFVLHIAAFFKKRSYRSLLKNCSAGPIAAFFKNAAIANAELRLKTQL